MMDGNSLPCSQKKGTQGVLQPMANDKHDISSEPVHDPIVFASLPESQLQSSAPSFFLGVALIQCDFLGGSSELLRLWNEDQAKAHVTVPNIARNPDAKG